ncbi:MAG TPA: sugar-binding protein [Thermoanaerobaculia bacterium]|jgi:hypothetical protein|nr:sugar-binding protein [Thermoanaerobaculia bacterium]
MHQRNLLHPRILLLAGLLLSAAVPARPEEAPGEPPYTVVPPRIERAPVVDGTIEDGEWQGAARLDGFTQLDPQEGAPATEATEVLVAYDTRNLYFAVRGNDSDPKGMVANILTRDGELTFDDTVEIILDTFNDGRNGFLFATNPLGVQVDALLRNEGEQVNFDWDGLWSCAAHRDAGGFTVEMAIPFRTLRFNPAESQTWGFNVTRLIARKRELVFWKPASHADGYYAHYKLSRYGRMAGLQGIEQGGRYLFKPYVLAGGEEPRQTRSTDGVGEVGGDLKINLTSQLVADLTYNTDFAEVEADEQVVNLNRSPVLLSEKREFFLEGANLFFFGERPEPHYGGERSFLFNSRRIGLTDDGAQAIPVIGGAKLTGQIGETGVGLLSLSTDDLSFVSHDGTLEREPQTNYSVLRLKREVYAKSTLGLIGLSADPSGTGANQVIGTDWDLALGKFLRAGGFLAKSRAPSFEGDTEGDDWALHADLYWDSRHARFHALYYDIGENFTDELGYIPRIGVRRWRWGSSAIAWPDSKIFREAWGTYNLDYITDRTGDLQTRVNNVEANTWLQNSAGIALKAYDYLEVLKEGFEIHPGVVIQPGTYSFNNYFFGFNTDYTKPLGGAGRVAWGDFYDGKLLQDFYALLYKPLPGLLTSVVYERTRVKLSAGRFTRELFLGEASYSFSPRLSARAWVQWSREDSLRAKGHVRWTYKPGADFYLIYEDRRWLADDPLLLSRQTFNNPGRSLLTKVGFVF